MLGGDPRRTVTHSLLELKKKVFVLCLRTEMTEKPRHGSGGLKMADDTYPHLRVGPAHHQLLGQGQLPVQALDGPLGLLRGHAPPQRE